jgi:hypothetical protein
MDHDFKIGDAVILKDTDPLAPWALLSSGSVSQRTKQELYEIEYNRNLGGSGSIYISGVEVRWSRMGKTEIVDKHLLERINKND